MNVLATEPWHSPDFALTEFVLDAAGVDAYDWILDIGCGTGKLGRYAAHRARHGQVLGLDISDDKLDRARELAMLEGLDNIRYTNGDIRHHRFEYGDFDVAIARHNVLTLDDPVAAFANIERALAPGCRLVVMLRRVVYGPSVVDLVAGAGFVDVAIDPVGPFVIASAKGSLGPDAVG